MITKKKLSGFSLIEISISLLIIGIISNICMSQLTAFMKINSIQKTQANCDIVIKSLGAYYIQVDGARLPQQIGVVDSDGFGHVPFKELGIMERFAKDGNGNWLLYKLNPNFNGSSSLSSTNLGVQDFASSLGDTIAITLKAVDRNKNKLYEIWYSKRNFISLFPPRQKQQPAKRNDLAVPVLQK